MIRCIKFFRPLMSLALILASASFSAAAPVSAGLQLWFKADAGVLNAGNTAATNGQKVGSWLDQSGRGPGFDVTQASVANQPSFSSTGFNGLPALVFNRGTSSADNTILQNFTNNVLPANSPRTVFVAAQTGDTKGGTLFTFRTGVPVATMQRLNLGPNYVYSDGATQNDNVNAGPGTLPFISTYRADASVTGATAQPQGTIVGLLTTDLNGTNEGTFGTTGGPASNFRSESSGATGFTVGERLDNGGGNLNQGWTGMIAEVLVYDRILSAPELNQTGFYLESKYGIASAYVPEPGTYAMALIGAVSLLGWGSARRRK